MQNPWIVAAASAALGTMLLACDVEADHEPLGLDELQSWPVDDAPNQDAKKGKSDTVTYCYTPPGDCDAECEEQEVPRFLACTMVYDPVCGCDGQTYGNSCVAFVNGASIDFEGACDGSGGGGVISL